MSNSLNQIIMEGRVCITPELKQTSGGTSVCTLNLALNRTYKNSQGEAVDEVTYIEVDTFGKMAENCSKYCPKGKLVQVVGRLKQDRWEDSDGKKHSKIRVIAEHIEFKSDPRPKEDQAKTVAMLGETIRAAVEELNKKDDPEDEVVF